MVKRATDVDKHVGKRVRQRRIELGLSQTELADALGVTFQQIQKYENGTNRVSAGRLYNMARHLDVPLDYFFEGLGLPAASQPTQEMAVRYDMQVIALVRGFIQISDADTRSNVTSLVNSIAKGEALQSRAAKETRGKAQIVDDLDIYRGAKLLIDPLRRNCHR